MGSGINPTQRANCLRDCGLGEWRLGLALATLLRRRACSSDTPPTPKISGRFSPSSSAEAMMSPASAARLMACPICSMAVSLALSKSLTVFCSSIPICFSLIFWDFLFGLCRSLNEFLIFDFGGWFNLSESVGVKASLWVRRGGRAGVF